MAHSRYRHSGASIVPLQMYDNGIAGLHVMGSNNFTFEATVRNGEEDISQGSVGSLDGQQPIEIIIEGSSLVTFTDMRVESANGE